MLTSIILFLFSIDSENILSDVVNFEIDHNLYKGHLLAQHQIEETAQNRDLTKQVEKIFIRWLRQIEMILVKGRQIRRDRADVGPVDELNYWRKTMAAYTCANEFVHTKPFANHLKCLILSRCKLTRKWEMLRDDMSMAINIAADNVKFVSSLETFYSPLYRDSEKIEKCFENLLKALRNVYTKSRFFNTSTAIAGFMIKCTNHLTIICKDFLVFEGTIFTQDVNETKRRLTV